MKIPKKKFVGLLALLLAVFFVACSDDSGSGTSAGFISEEDDPSSYIAEKIVPIKNKNLSLNSFSFLQGDDARGKV